MAFADVVAVPFGDGNDDVAFDDGLAAEAGVELVVGGLLDAVEFVVFHLGKVVAAFLYNDMTGGAGAAAAAGVLEVEAIVHGDVEQGAGLAVAFVFKLFRLEFESFAGREKGHFGHLTIIADAFSNYCICGVLASVGAAAK